jgi:hypothetical protein
MLMQQREKMGCVLGISPGCLNEKSPGGKLGELGILKPCEQRSCDHVSFGVIFLEKIAVQSCEQSGGVELMRAQSQFIQADIDHAVHIWHPEAPMEYRHQAG